MNRARPTWATESACCQASQRLTVTPSTATPNPAITAAATGQADIVAITPPIIAAIAKRSPARGFETKFVLQSYQLGMAMRKNQPELMAWVNGWIKTNLANGKLNDIHLKFAGVAIPDEIVNGAK